VVDSRTAVHVELVKFIIITKAPHWAQSTDTLNSYIRILRKM